MDNIVNIIPNIYRIVFTNRSSGKFDSCGYLLRETFVIGGKWWYYSGDCFLLSKTGGTILVKLIQIKIDMPDVIKFGRWNNKFLSGKKLIRILFHRNNFWWLYMIGVKWTDHISCWWTVIAPPQTRPRIFQKECDDL